MSLFVVGKKHVFNDAKIKIIAEAFVSDKERNLLVFDDKNQEKFTSKKFPLLFCCNICGIHVEQVSLNSKLFSIPLLCR